MAHSLSRLPDAYCRYRDIIADIEKEREEKRNAKAQEGGWKPPFDFSAYSDLWTNETNMRIMQSMDKAIKSVPKEGEAKHEDVPRSPGYNWEVGDDDPYPDEGPLWLEEEAKGDEWKYGKVFTINSTARYTIDVKAKKVCSRVCLANSWAQTEE